MTKSKLFISLFIIPIGLLVSACGASVEKLNQEGNQAFAEQAYLEALEAYHSAQLESPELAEPYYNAANALYKQGAYQEAISQLQRALQFAENSQLAESSFYNSGNSFYNNQELEAAFESYKNALLLNPNDLDAKHNLELTIQQQEQKQQQKEQQEQEENQNQENNQDQQDQQDQPQDSDYQEDQENNQTSENQNDDQQSDQSEENQDKESSDGDQDSEQESNESNEDQQQKNDPNSQENQQNDGQDQDKDNQDHDQNGQIPAPGQRMTAEQAQQLLAALAQDMQSLQEKLGQILFVQQPPPVQDW